LTALYSLAVACHPFIITDVLRATGHSQLPGATLLAAGSGSLGIQSRLPGLDTRRMSRNTAPAQTLFLLEYLLNKVHWFSLFVFCLAWSINRYGNISRWCSLPSIRNCPLYEACCCSDVALDSVKETICLLFANDVLFWGLGNVSICCCIQYSWLLLLFYRLYTVSVRQTANYLFELVLGTLRPINLNNSFCLQTVH